MIVYFEAKNLNDLKNSKHFWNFYTASIRIISDKSNDILPTSITDDEKFASDPMAIGNNDFFTKICSNSLA